MLRKTLIACAIATSVTMLGTGSQAQQLNVAIATGGTGGVYYPLGGGMANVLTKYLPNTAATARVTGGSVDNLKLINSQQSEVALVMVDAARDALKGEDKFKGSPVEVRTLMVLYPNRMHVVTVEGRGIEKMSDLKGKRVSTGSPGSATEVMAFRVIEAAGLDKDKDMRRERLGVAESSTGVIPAKTYPGQDKDNQIAVVQNILVANAKMPDQVAYDIVKTLFEKRDELVAVHGEAKAIVLETQNDKNTTIPWHPGAKKYFAEKGAKM
jgi:TRAP-type uncharacterized transport system substrate-binding protein